MSTPSSSEFPPAEASRAASGGPKSFTAAKRKSVTALRCSLPVNVACFSFAGTK